MSDNYIVVRDFPNGLRAAVERMLFEKYRIVVGPVRHWATGYDKAY